MTQSWKAKNEALAKIWRSHIDQWSSTRLSQTEYCRQNDLSRHRFTYWKRKFYPTKNLPVEFVQINPEPINMTFTGLKLNIGPELQIEIPNGFSRTTLEQVLMTLKVLQ